MHPLTCAYNWFNCQANINNHSKEGDTVRLQANEPVCLLVWNDKKYKSKDKKVVFITKCISAAPTSGKEQYHSKNIRDAAYQYERILIPSPPILKPTTIAWAA